VRGRTRDGVVERLGLLEVALVTGAGDHDERRIRDPAGVSTRSRRECSHAPCSATVTNHARPVALSPRRIGTELLPRRLAGILDRGGGEMAHAIGDRLAQVALVGGEEIGEGRAPVSGTPQTPAVELSMRHAPLTHRYQDAPRLEPALRDSDDELAALCDAPVHTAVLRWGAE
jgi:hypothetical protein